MVVGVILGLGLALPITASTGIGVVTGVAQGVSHQQKENEKAANANPESRTTKFYLDCSVEDDQQKGRGAILDGGIVVVRDDKLWIEPKGRLTGLPKRPDSHPFTGFYLMYPDENRDPAERGLVSTISRDPPMLNWIYIDKKTFELKYSNRSGSIAEMVGPWDWTEESDDSNLTLDEWEGFVAVEEEGYLDEEGKPRWAIYYDMNDDGLKSKKKGRRTLEVSLKRRLVEDQEKNKWGVGREGNIGFKTTREI